MNCKCPKCGAEFESIEPASEQSKSDRDLETIGAGFELALRIDDDELFTCLDLALMALLDEIEEERKAHH